MMNMPDDLSNPLLSANAELVLAKRYYRKSEDDNTTEDGRKLFWRVASSIASEEAKYDDSTWTEEKLALAFYELMSQGIFLPNSPTLMNAGSELGQLSACFVLPIGDSIEEIFDAVKFAAMIHKSGGGTGFSFSRLRPKDSRVGSTGGVASGPVSFLRIFNTATEQIKQGGTRRGANMGILRVDHPDILDFIRAKEKEGEFNNFNLSVGLTEAFMQAVDANESYPLIDPSSNAPCGSLNARDVFDMLVNKAWLSGDPGIVFLDRINRDNPTPAQGDMESTNPCGEQPLLPYEACNLGSINLARFVLPSFSEKAADGVNWEDLRRVIHLAVRFLDNVIDASRFPLDRIAEKVRTNRKIGLGVMGWADMLFQLGVAYDSQEALDLAENVMQFLQTEGRAASTLLAKERGAFPAFAESTYAAQGLPPLRNATVTTIAPTGTLSIIGACSSGVEPLFALCFARNVMDGERLVEVNPYFESALQTSNYHTPELMEAVAACGSIQDMDFLPAHMRRIFVTAMDISPEAHLRMQAAFQKYTDNAVSKTVNLPNNATIDDIAHIYRMAFEQGCKGVTVYRDGCKSVQVLTTGDGDKKAAAEAGHSTIVRQRPDMVQGFTQKVQTGLGVLYLTVNEVDGQPFEVFATIGKSGRSITAKAEAIGRLVSLCFRSGVSARDVIAQLKGIGGEHPIFQKKGLLLSIPDAIAWVLENRYLKGSKPVLSSTAQDLTRPACPECGEEMQFQEGCHICPNCGFSRCG